VKLIRVLLDVNRDHNDMGCNDDRCMFNSKQNSNKISNGSIFEVAYK
jgi:hypothetical protein